MTTDSAATERRALQSKGSSSGPIYEMVAAAIANCRPDGGILLDVGCGQGLLWPFVRDKFGQYIGADVVRYDGLSEEATFHRIDLDSGRVPLPDGAADVVVAVETIEHLENPRAFARELTRLCKPGGWIIITTPNQLSFLSKLTLLVKNSFNAFTDTSYPAHITALLETDLRRIAAECGWQETTIRFTESGRIPGTGHHWPRWMSRVLPRAFSDNICVSGRKV
ncbi:MAG: SAM-dependent methyltransferase [Pirellula sp.]|nr:SAM-dependent methyltransferase [Pirellula sp.]